MNLGQRQFCPLGEPNLINCFHRTLFHLSSNTFSFFVPTLNFVFNVTVTATPRSPTDLLANRYPAAHHLPIHNNANTATMPTFVQMKKSKFIMWTIRSKFLILACLAALLIFHFASDLAHIPYEIRRFSVLHSVKNQKNGQVYNTSNSDATPILIPEVNSKYAFATFLTGGDDHYFVGTRILTYQLLHAPDTRSRDRAIPFIVLVTDSVHEEDRARLRKDGAIVVVQSSIQEEWVLPGVARWADVLTKLRFWQFTQFERICFLDGDTVLAHPLDDIFSDEAVLSMPSGKNERQIFADEAPLPANYSFASTPALKAKHHYPPTEHGGDFRMDYLVRTFSPCDLSIHLGYLG